MPRPTSHFGFAPAPVPVPAPAPAPVPAPVPAAIASTSTSAVQTFSQDSDDEDEPIEEDTDSFPRRKFQLFGFLLSILSSLSISFGISNVVVTALVVIIPSDSWGCLQPDSSASQSYKDVYQALGPINSTMEFADWCWISVGIWASITVFISGNVAGSISKAFSHQSKLFAVFGLISVFIFLPFALIFASLDAAMSYYCSTAKVSPQPAKFAMPLLVGIFSLAEIVLTIGVFAILRKELRKRRSDANESTSTPSSPASSPVHSPASTLTPSTGKSPASSPEPELGQGLAREPYPVRQQVFPTRNVGPPLPPMRRRPAPPYYNPMLEPPIRRQNGPPLYSADPRLRQFPDPNADQIPYRYNGLPRPTIYDGIQPPYRGPQNPNRNPPQRYYPSRPTIPRPNVSLPPKVPGGYQDYREPYTGVNRNSGIFGNNFMSSRLFPSMQGGKAAPNRAYTHYT
jgi:hypothetical protein